MYMEMLKSRMKNSKDIVFLGGAGVSTESGIPDFRSSAGIYKNKNNSEYFAESVLSHTFFREHTDQFFEFYKENMLYPDAKPNDAHYALAQMEREGRLKAIITQNIDGLHQMAGSVNVIEIHGSVHRNYCLKCNKTYNLEDIIRSNGIPKCGLCGGIIRPDVVLYEESIDIQMLHKAIEYIKGAEIFIVGGTSLNVYPAAGLLDYYRGENLVLINKTSTSYDSRADYIFRESISKILKSLL